MAKAISFFLRQGQFKSCFSHQLSFGKGVSVDNESSSTMYSLASLFIQEESISAICFLCLTIFLVLIIIETVRMIKMLGLKIFPILVHLPYTKACVSI